MPMNHPDGISLDHVQPKSAGGKNHGNLTVAHRRCNVSKGSDAPTQDHRTALMIIKARTRAAWKKRVTR
jgi:5-methylcytosine-specific restriction endonuclease McrA